LLARPEIWLVLLTCACLAPFAGKAFHIDDTLFLRAAEQIRKHPLDFYGFNINWFGDTTPMIDAFDNPPLTSYFIALVSLVGGWSELALHLAFLLPAIAAALGTYTLARNYCDRPGLAALAVVLTPLFLISGTTLMCDMLLLALWVWAVALFENGLGRPSAAIFLSSGMLGGLAVLTKFTGLSLVPLLLVYGGMKLRRPGWWLAAPLVPLLFAAGYEWLTYRLYGHGLLTYAATYTAKFRESTHGNSWENGVWGIAFMGGCFLTTLFYAPWLWSRRGLLAGVCLAGACVVVLPYLARLTKLLWQPQGGLNWAMFLQCAACAIAGIQILALALSDVWERRDATSVMLVLWILGVTAFGAVINWTITARSFLPLAPALGILIARRSERNQGAFSKLRPVWLAWPVFAAAVVGLILVKADYNLANSGRRAAQSLVKEHSHPEKQLWFAGHWGFQYYMELYGAKPVDSRKPEMKSGDLVVYPNHGSNIGIPDLTTMKHFSTLTYPAKLGVATMNPSVGAGFYAAVIGPLPFAIGTLEPERYQVFEVK
jgi:4-amino-4-deoxy-L-arabinose transferase-like glycosyltransferase